MNIIRVLYWNNMKGFTVSMDFMMQFCFHGYFNGLFIFALYVLFQISGHKRKFLLQLVILIKGSIIYLFFN